jgi:hypothetical protein
MNKPDKSQTVKLHPQTSIRSPAVKAERIDRADENLMPCLIDLGIILRPGQRQR